MAAEEIHEGSVDDAHNASEAEPWWAEQAREPVTGPPPAPGQPPASGQYPGQPVWAPQPHKVQKQPSAWRRWRRSRPFWGGLLIVLGASEILASVRAPLPVVVHVGMQGLATYLVPIIMLLCGLLLWFNPDQRIFYSIIAILMALTSWITSNLGGFFIGILFGVIGGSLAFAWTRPKPAPEESAPAASSTGGSPESP
jgi:hypothetical protein